MDIKELDKKQLILLTLLLTFVVSIATGIVTVSLMNQMPKSVPQIINNVIQRTIEKVKTVEVPLTSEQNSNNVVSGKITSDSDALVSIYSKDSEVFSEKGNESSSELNPEVKPLGQGVIISDVGLILIDSSVVSDESGLYKTVLNNIEFKASVLKKYNNGFTILKISEKESSATENKNTTATE